MQRRFVLTPYFYIHADLLVLIDVLNPANDPF